MQLIVNYPDKLPDALQQSAEQFEHEAKMAMAAKLYELKCELRANTQMIPKKHCCS